MGNILEIHDGDFSLKIYLDTLHEFPVSNFRRLLRLLRVYPEEMEKLGAYLQEQYEICRAGWAKRSEEYAEGYRPVNPRSRATAAKQIRAENQVLRSNLRQAKKLYDAYAKRRQIYEIQGGNYYA